MSFKLRKPGVPFATGVDFDVQALISKSGETSESDECTIKTKEYYDIVIIGRTGQGKSTLGNKLLNLKTTPESRIRLFEFLPHSGSEKKRFIQASDSEVTSEWPIFSVTRKCKLLANDDTNIRVLDVPGFSDHDSGRLEAVGMEVSVKEANLQIMRWVMRAQLEFKLKVRRIVYFLPARGPLEKADGALQEELNMIHHYFGKDIFNCMVVVATVHDHKKYQMIGFDEDDIKDTQRVLGVALRWAISEKGKCPPITFIGTKDSSEKCFSKIKGALVSESIFSLLFQEDTCTRCSVKIHRNEEKKITVATGEVIPYTASKCHPCFVQKHSMMPKAFGENGDIATLGIGLILAYVQRSWPGFANSDEVCIACKKSPGAVGCRTVGMEMSYTNIGIKLVDHSNKL